LNWQAQLAIVHIRKYENNYIAGGARKFVTSLFWELKKWSAKAEVVRSGDDAFGVGAR
jgi:hypothetical protein